MADSRTLTKASAVELSIVVLICGAIAGGASWATRMTVSQEDLLRQVSELRGLIKERTDARWTSEHMDSWVQHANREMQLWAERNGTPAYTFPDPRTIRGQ